MAAETAAFLAWLAERRAAPTIAALRRHAAGIQAAETAWALAHLGDLSARDRQVVAALAARLVGKLLHAPTVHLREAAAAVITPAPTLNNGCRLENLSLQTPGFADVSGASRFHPDSI